MQSVWILFQKLESNLSLKPMHNCQKFSRFKSLLTTVEWHCNVHLCIRIVLKNTMERQTGSLSAPGNSQWHVASTSKGRGVILWIGSYINEVVAKIWHCRTLFRKTDIIDDWLIECLMSNGKYFRHIQDQSILMNKKDWNPSFY